MAMDNMRGLAQELRKRGGAPRPGATEGRLRPVMPAVLVFAVAVGLPMVTVPALRARLRSRIEKLREALSSPGVVSQPAFARVGENKEPFPAEYERPVSPVPQWRGVIDLAARTYRAEPPAAERSAPADPAPEPEAAATDQEPTFRQGPIEQQAYELLLQSNPVLASMAIGGDPTLRFRTWAAARAEEDDALLVKVTFTYLPDNSDREYIWKVKMLAKEVVPLSSYARSLSGPRD